MSSKTLVCRTAPGNRRVVRKAWIPGQRGRKATVFCKRRSEHEALRRLKAGQRRHGSIKQRTQLLGIVFCGVDDRQEDPIYDLVLPRMRGTAGATYILGTSLVGLALGPYWAGKVAALTGSLSIGVFSLLVVPPFTFAALWIASRHIGELEATREERAAAA